MSTLNFWRIQQGIRLQNGTSSGAFILGADAGTLTLTDATTKQGVLVTPHYTNAQTPVAVFFSQNTSSSNDLYIGGGSGSNTAIKNLYLYTASNNTTTGGTLVGHIDGSGAWTIGATNSTASHLVYGKWNFGGTSENSIVNINHSTTSNPLTGTVQRGYLSDFTATSATTNTVIGFQASINLAASTATGQLIGFESAGFSMGAGSTANESICFLGTTSTIATANAIFSDSASFSGNWFIYQGGTTKNLLTGPTSIGGTTTNDNAASGVVGEYVSASVTSNTNTGASATGFTATSISLTAGDWDVSGILQINSGGATFTSTDFYVGITTTAGGGAGLTSVNSAEITGTLPLTFGKVPLIPPVVRMSLASTTTVYLNGYVSIYTAGQPVYIASMIARRVR